MARMGSADSNAIAFPRPVVEPPPIAIAHHLRAAAVQRREPPRPFLIGTCITARSKNASTIPFAGINWQPVRRCDAALAWTVRAHAGRRALQFRGSGNLGFLRQNDARSLTVVDKRLHAHFRWKSGSRRSQNQSKEWHVHPGVIRRSPLVHAVPSLRPGRTVRQIPHRNRDTGRYRKHG